VSETHHRRARLVRAAATFAVLLLAGCGGGSSPTTGSLMQTGSGVSQVANEGWIHVPEGTAITYVHNPPASGPHYPVWARYEEFSAPLGRGYYVHNLEHGAIVFLYRPDAPAATISALRDVFRSLPADPECGHPRALMTPDPLIPRPISVVAADWLLEAESVDAAAIRTFASVHRSHAPEDICASGTRP
jgi:plasmid stabilization system protein ParE